jgi:hypothetical protein
LRAYYPTHAVPTTEAASSELLPRQRLQETDLGSVPENDQPRRRGLPVTTDRPMTPSPTVADAVPLDHLLADQPPVLDVGDNLDQVRQGRRVVFLDDDPPVRRPSLTYPC